MSQDMSSHGMMYAKKCTVVSLSSVRAIISGKEPPLQKYWFHYIGEDLQDSEIISTKFQPRIQALALQAELDYERDVELRVYRMQPSAKNGNLAIITVKGKLDGKTIDKGGSSRTP